MAVQTEIFKSFDLGRFWDDNDFSLNEYRESPPSADLIASIEEELGYRLPASYIALMQTANGGMPVNTCFPTREATSWDAGHVAICGIFGIGRTRNYSLCGPFGSPFMIREWGYPADGVYICDCLSAGHDMILLDYTRCGPGGEPEVVHVDQERGFRKTFLAKDFETFIRGLVSADLYDAPLEDLEALKEGCYSDILKILAASE
ncbi:SMI1/KNR4 family protein [Paraflavisolibacter sp. H34]|uniref:SMI1/KNR4 family protein n=1 Tax=Huijunlia imazamoxiresistens TaxID=3127457 RepID=UPI003017FB27